MSKYFLCVLASCQIGFDGGGALAQNGKTSDNYNWDLRMKALGLVDVCFWEPSLQYYLVYATKNNFMGKPLYNSKLTKAWLHPHAARKLIHAQEILHNQYPQLSLLIYDAARPIEVQRAMDAWAKKSNNEYYIADPTKGGGLHNYGMAVDVTLVDAKGEWLSMGTPFDYFGPESHTDNEDELLQLRRITPSEYRNRRLLRGVMEEAGFTTVASEWWHFNACTRETAKANYQLIDR
jgi:D-alanyl-D-alanine dipeptidase